jgi:putative SOS response-associated peptidase YedK
MATPVATILDKYTVSVAATVIPIQTWARLQQNCPMCSKYQSVRLDDDLRHFFRAMPTAMPLDLKKDVFPGYTAPFIRRPRERDSGDEAVPEREAVVGRFGLIPHYNKEEKVRFTYNARSETAARANPFRDAWKWGNHCIIPAWVIWEPDWRTGNNIWTRIGRADGRPLGVAGLWSRWQTPAGADILSFTMLTVNADRHAFMCNYHRPDDEKRMVVVLGEDQYDAWLDAAPERSMEFMRPCPPQDMVALQEPPM